MAETSGFFDAEELIGGEFDREYVSEQFARYFALFIGNGVFASPTNQLKVVAGEGMNIVVKEGWAFINGRWYHNDSDLIIPVPPNTTATTITSGVFVHQTKSDRDIHSILATGRTIPDREEPYWELKLAELQIPTGVTSITDAMIIDTRMNENVCGFVKGLLDGVISTEDLFAQYQSIFDDFMEHIHGQLDEDIAGHLQLEIDEMNELEYESADDNLTPTSKVDVDLLESGETQVSRWGKVSQMFKNIRYLLKMLGTTDISSIGGGTITGAISALNTGKVGTGDTIAVAHGGTGATTAAGARNALGLGNTSGAVPVANGGTGATTAANARTNLGVAYGSSAGTVCQGNDSRLSDNRYPVSHESPTTEYGKATATYYGHVKLSNATNSTADTGTGTAATPMAVKLAYELAASKSNALLLKSAAVTKSVTNETAWTVTVTQSGYTPIMFCYTNNMSGAVISNIESSTLSNGKAEFTGFATSKNGNALSVTFTVQVLWRKN